MIHISAFAFFCFPELFLLCDSVGLGRPAVGRDSSVSIGQLGSEQGRRIVNGNVLGSLVDLCVVFSITAIVLGNVMHNETIGNPNDEEEPEDVECLKCGEQPTCDHKGKRALKLLAGPVHLVGSNGLELREEAVDDAQVEVVAEVNPHAHKYKVEGTHEGAVDVVERLGCLPVVSDRKSN